MLVLPGQGPSVVDASANTPKPDILGPNADPPAAARAPEIERDLDQIRAYGCLRMATSGGANGYFLQKGGDAGFEYELLLEFARVWNLRLEVVIPEPWESLQDLLESGQADVAAADLAPDPLAERVSYTRPCDMIREVLVLYGDRNDEVGWDVLDGLEVWVPANSGALRTLWTLRQDLGYRVTVEMATPGVTAQALIARVGRGEIPAAVVPARLASAARSRCPALAVGPVLSDSRPVVWAVRRQSPELLAALDEFLGEQFQVTASGPRRGALHGVLTERYYGDPHALSEGGGASDPAASGRLSVWDDLIRSAADSVGFDWRLLAALIYEESRFDARAVSPAGAIGLMQVRPGGGTSDSASLRDPILNVRAGVRLLRDIHAAFAGCDSTDRWALTLATYFAGSGRLAEARRTAAALGHDPDRWQDAVAAGMLQVERARAESGGAPYPGTSTIKYVRAVLNRYDLYRRIVPLTPVTTPPRAQPADEQLALAHPESRPLDRPPL